MGLRYRKSVKICKGVRVNFSKSGVSYTIGTKGASVNIGKNGAYLNTGIPGTGIYSREKIGGGASESPQRSQRPETASSVEVQVVMNDRGKIILMQNGVEITDEAFIRKIKASPAFQAEKQRLETLRRETIDSILDDERKASDEVIKIYKKSPAVDSLETFEKALRTLVPETYKRKTFRAPAPSEENIKSDLMIEAVKNVSTWAFWRRTKLRNQYVAERLPGALDEAWKQWDRQKADFEAAEDAEENRNNQEYQHDYEMTKLGLQKAIEGEHDFICALIDSWISDCTLPLEVNIDYDYQEGCRTLLLDIDLPEIEDLPSTKMVKLSSGNLSAKKKTQAELKQDYACLVFGLAVFISANMFNLSPAIGWITLSGYTQRRNTAGDIEDNYILSVRFDREAFERERLSEVDPMEFVMRFENRCNVTSTMLLRKIKPFEE